MAASGFARLPKPPYYAVIFSSLRNSQDEAGYGVMAERMVELAQQQPGFLGMESTRGADGFGITVAYWKARPRSSPGASMPSTRPRASRAGGTGTTTSNCGSPGSSGPTAGTAEPPSTADSAKIRAPYGRYPPEDCMSDILTTILARKADKDRRAQRPRPRWPTCARASPMLRRRAASPTH